MSGNEEFIQEFLQESTENLDQFDQDLVTLEKDPQDQQALGSVFRTIHTLKGTCGFFGFSKLGALSHAGENLLGKLRDQSVPLTEPRASCLLKLSDTIREILVNLETSGKEGAGDYRELVSQLDLLCRPEEEEEEEEVRQLDTVAEPTAQGEAEPTEPLGTSSAEAEVDAVAGTGTAAPQREPAAVEANEAAGASTETARSAPPKRAATDGSLRVDLGLLDSLMDLASELVLARNRLRRIVQDQGDRPLQEAVHRIDLITSDLQERILQTRMQPISVLASKLPRLVRDIAKDCGKRVGMKLCGTETELDRSLVEAIKDPLTHLVRNAIDHGLETPEVREQRGKDPEGSLILRASQSGGFVHIELEDDGAGIDLERIKQIAIQRNLADESEVEDLGDAQLIDLIFAPGFSTASRISDLSGRGVGMDVVRTNIEGIGGTINCINRPGEGVTVHLAVPLTLTIIPAMVGSCCEELYVIPQACIEEILQVTPESAMEEVCSVEDTLMIKHRGQYLPLLMLENLLEVTSSEERFLQRRPALVIRVDCYRYALLVDHLVDGDEIVVRSLHSSLARLPVYSGATVMGDGQIALILDMPGLARVADLTPSRMASAFDAVAEQSTERLGAFLLCHSTNSDRLAIPLAEVERILKTPARMLESLRGSYVVRYEEEFLPLQHEPGFQPAGILSIVVCRCGQDRRGLVVSQAVDIVDGAAGLQQVTTESGTASALEHDGLLYEIPARFSTAGLATGESR